LLIFCNPADNFDVGVDGLIFMLADFGQLWVVGCVFFFVVWYPGHFLW